MDLGRGVILWNILFFFVSYVIWACQGDERWFSRLALGVILLALIRIEVAIKDK